MNFRDVEDWVVRSAMEIFNLPQDKVRIDIRAPLQETYGYGHLGMCTKNFQNGVIYIFVDSELPLLNRIITLCHEIVHAHQILEKRMEYIKGNNEIVIFDRKVVDTTKTPYMELPWEKEAFSKEKQYAKIFFNCAPLGLLKTLEGIFG